MDLILSVIASVLIYSAMYGPTPGAVALKHISAWLAILLMADELTTEAAFNAAIVLMVSAILMRLAHKILAALKK
jgi:hypothetical protein